MKVTCLMINKLLFEALGPVSGFAKPVGNRRKATMLMAGERTMVKSKGIRWNASHWAALVCAGLMPATAAAEEASDAADAPADAEIIVTATKRSESIQRIPASISAFDAEQLAQRGVTDLRGLAQQSPGINFSDFAGTTFLTIRGIGISVDTGTAEPSVASYIDGVLLPRPTMGKLRLIDLERVEILRGPQGTLYGRNATAGAVNYISAKPTQEFRAGVDLGYGNYDHREISGFVSGGLGEGIAVRFSASREIQDGYIRNLANGDRYGNIDFWNVRGAVRLQPSANVTIDLSAQYQENDNADAVQQIFQFTIPLAPGSQRSSVPNRFYADRPSVGNNSLLVLSGILNWEASSNLTVRTVTGYVDHKSKVSYDADASTTPRVTLEGFSRPSESFSQELNLIGEFGPVKLVLGAYYFHENFTVETPVFFPAGLGATIPVGAINYRSFDQTVNSYALFTDGTVLLSDRFRINFGLRYNSDKSDLLQSSGLLLANGTFNGSRDVPGKIKSERLLPKVGAEFDLAPNVLLYAQYQKGFKAAGPNLGVINKPFSPESINAYEIGLKSQFLNGRLIANFAGFRYDYGSLQVTNTPPGAVTSSIVNASARINGLEAELRFRPTDYIDLNLAATYLDAGYREFFGIDGFQPALGVQDLSGNELNRVAPFSANAGIGVRVPLSTPLFDELALRADASYSDRYFLRQFNLRPQDLQKEYVNIDASLTLSSTKNFSLRLYGKNLTDRKVKGLVSFSGTVGGFLTGYSPPRMYGAVLSYRY